MKLMVYRLLPAPLPPIPLVSFCADWLKLIEVNPEHGAKYGKLVLVRYPFADKQRLDGVRRYARAFGNLGVSEP
jgi:hypothetical protein